MSPGRVPVGRSGRCRSRCRCRCRILRRLGCRTALRTRTEPESVRRSRNRSRCRCRCRRRGRIRHRQRHRPRLRKSASLSIPDEGRDRGSPRHRQRLRLRHRRALGPKSEPRAHCPARPMGQGPVKPDGCRRDPPPGDFSRREPHSPEGGETVRWLPSRHSRATITLPLPLRGGPAPT